MSRRRIIVFSLVLNVPWAIVIAASLAHAATSQSRSTGGWTLPADAAQTTTPLKVNDNVLAIGKKLYADKCQKCHGATGLGDGPDADPDHPEHMNLTNPQRAERNPDGVVFYKVLNGRRNPKMPAFKDQLSTEQIWSVVAYVQTLRRK